METHACDLADPKAVQVGGRCCLPMGKHPSIGPGLPPSYGTLPRPANCLLSHRTPFQALADKLAGMGVTCLINNAGVFLGGDDDPLKGAHFLLRCLRMCSLAQGRQAQPAMVHRLLQLCRACLWAHNRLSPAAVPTLPV